MADISKVKLPDNSEYDIKDAKKTGVYYVKGTQTAATGAWTGNIDVPALYTGLTIMYYLPYNGSGNATLNLTLSDGTTTGAKNCYITTARLTTHYGAGRNILMTFYKAGDISISGTATTDDRWICDAYYDSNDHYYLRRSQTNILAGPNNIFPYTIIMQIADGRWESIVTSSSTGTSKARNTHGFRLCQILLMYANATYNENVRVANNNIWDQYSANVDHRYSFNTANNATHGTTANKPIYIVGALNASDGLFYLDATWWTQTLPSSDDGKLYIYIGDAYDYYRMNFVVNHPIYWYKNGAVRLFTQDAATVTGHTVAKDVPSDAVFTDTTYTGTGLISVNASTGVISTTATANTGTITSVKTTAGAHSTINVTSGAANFNIPTTAAHVGALASTTKYAASASTGGPASTLAGTYSGSGGKQAPNYYGTNKVGALMSNETVNGDSHYKNWLYMDNYNGNDAGGATAIGVDRTEARAFIMQSDANRTSWNNTAELAKTTDIPTKTSQLTNDSGFVTTDTTYTGTGAISVDASTHVISTTAEANQNAFSNVKVGSTTVAADTKTDTIEFIAGSNVTLTPDATNDKITFAASTGNRRAFFGTCSTAAATAAKVVTLSDTDGWELKAGTTIGVKFSTTNTASNVTLNVNDSGAKSIYYNNAVYTSTSSTVCGYANRVIYYMYDGTNWVWMAYSVDTNSDTKVRQTLISDNTDRPLLLAYDNNSSTTANRDNVCYRNNSIYANPSTGNVHMSKLNETDISEYMTNNSFNERFGYDTENNGYMASLFFKNISGNYNLARTTTSNDATYWDYTYHPLWQNLSVRQINGIAMGGLRVFNYKALTNVCFSIPKKDSADVAITGLLFCRDAIFKFYIAVSQDNTTTSQNIQKFTTGSTTFNATISSGSITDPVLGNLWQFNIAFSGAWWTQAKYIITNYTGVSRNPSIYFSAINSAGEVRWEYAYRHTDEE